MPHDKRRTGHVAGHATAHDHVRIAVPSRGQGWTTISVAAAEYARMKNLASGSSTDPYRRVSEVCREAANDLRNRGCTGPWSPAVRKLALDKLRGTYRLDRAEGPHLLNAK